MKNIAKEDLFQAINQIKDKEPDFEHRIMNYFKTVEEVSHALGMTSKAATKRILLNLATSPLIYFGTTSVKEKELLLKISELQIETADIYHKIKNQLNEKGDNDNGTTIMA